MLRLRTTRELWKKSSKLDAQTQHAMETLKAAQRTVSTTMDRDTANGLCAAREIAEELALDGYFGPLYELFEVDDRYKTAVEVTAGTRSAFSKKTHASRHSCADSLPTCLSCEQSFPNRRRHRRHGNQDP